MSGADFPLSRLAMEAGAPDFRTIARQAVGGIGAAVVLYVSIDRLYVVNHVGLVHRLGDPWSILPVWIAAGAVAGIIRGFWIDFRLRRHAEGFGATRRDAEPLVDSDPCPDPVVADEQDPWRRDPTLREMPLLREQSGPKSRSHEVDHRTTGTHRDRLVEVFDLTTETRSSSDGSSRTLRRTVVLLPGVGLPDFELRPRTMGRRVLRGIGLSGLDFDTGRVETRDEGEAVASFKKSYDVALHDIFLVTGPATAESAEGEELRRDDGAEAAIRRLFTPAAMRVLNRWPGWSSESHGGHLALWRDDGWFIPADERPSRVAEALAIADALEDARSGEDRSGPVPSPLGPSLREQSNRMQATAGAGCAGGFGGFFLGFAAFAALMFAAHPRPGRVGIPDRPPAWYFPVFVLGGMLAGGLIGASAGRFVVFPIVRDCPPLVRPGSRQASRRGLSWRMLAGAFLGFMLGGMLSMLATLALTVRGRPLQEPMTALIPLLFFGIPGIGLFVGMTLGLILEFRHGARIAARAASEEGMRIRHE